ncbi:MAG: Ppx/GppA family phosphatase [Candidatus Omnitrophica bacterium]|nr:Ppx/GppA family phosphatase [Candidatus Omnitrophota bacterium]
MPEPTIQKQTVAVIDIGSSAIRMVIAEIGPKFEMRHLENLQKPVAFGKDVFTTGRISNAVIREGIVVLKNFKSVLDSYGVKNVHAIATSAVREAANRENFIDQVFVRTGIDVEVIEGPEENRLELIAVEHALGEKFDFQNKSCLIIEVGSGSTEMIIFSKGEVELTRTLSIGSIRLPEQAIAGKTESAQMQRVLKRSIRDIAQYAGREYNLGDINTFIAVGGDMRFVSRQLTEKIEGDYVILEKTTFLKFIDSLAKMPADEISDKYGIAYSEAETLYPSLLIYANFLAETRTENIVVPMVSIREGLLLEQAQILSGFKRTDVSKQVISSCRRLGRKYMYDGPHALCVAANAIKLFDNLKEEHGLGAKDRLLLEAAAILHDIGMYISPQGHHKHSSYLIDAADIFGLRKSDKNIISNVVRYHRRTTPQTTHVAYMSLTKSDRAIVSKLAAILRVADAIDKSHTQKIRNFQLERSGDNFILWVPEEAGDISIERDGLSKKGDMFAENFGSTITLKQGAPPK